jgi:hypothetical protein
MIDDSNNDDDDDNNDDIEGQDNGDDDKSTIKNHNKIIDIHNDDGDRLDDNSHYDTAVMIQDKQLSYLK